MTRQERRNRITDEFIELMTDIMSDDKLSGEERRYSARSEVEQLETEIEMICEDLIELERVLSGAISEKLSEFDFHIKGKKNFSIRINM